MIKEEIEVINKLGLHARASSKLVQLATTFSSEIFIEKDGRRANAKSIMALMMLAATKGSKLLLITEGEDEIKAHQKVKQLFLDSFGETII